MEKIIDFFKKHPLIEPKTFLGDAAFDTIEIYKSLFEDIGFRNAFIPLRAYPGIERSSKEWENTYKIRVNVEKSINHFKDSCNIANRKTQNEKTLHADLLLAGITQLVTVIVADKIHQYKYIRSLKPLIA